MDDIDEFDDEETFLNLDDVLQGATSSCSDPLSGAKPASTLKKQTCAKWVCSCENIHEEHEQVLLHIMLSLSCICMQCASRLCRY